MMLRRRCAYRISSVPPEKEISEVLIPIMRALSTTIVDRATARNLWNAFECEVICHICIKECGGVQMMVINSSFKKYLHRDMACRANCNRSAFPFGSVLAKSESDRFMVLRTINLR